MKTTGLVGAALLVLPACGPAPSPNVASSNGSVAAGAAATGSATTTEAPATRSETPSATSSSAAAATSSAPTASTPAEGPVPDAACASCAEGYVRFGRVGGRASHRTYSTVDPCRVYRRTRAPVAAGGEAPISCAGSLSCDASDTGAGKLRDLMKNADVQKALTDPMTVYGCDPRPIDGALFGVEVADGRSFGVGGECAGRCATKPGKCVNPLAGVAALVAFLKGLDEKMRSQEPCKSAFDSN